jgi:hypothetical protein
LASIGGDFGVVAGMAKDRKGIELQALKEIR